MKTEFSNLY